MVRSTREEGDDGNVKWTYEVRPETARWFRLCFESPMANAGQPQVSDMSFRLRDQRIEKPVEADGIAKTDGRLLAH